MLDLSNLDSKAVFCLGTTFGIGIGLCITYLTGSRKKSEEKNIPEDTNPSFDNVSSDLKCVIVVRMDLKMGKGKVAAQCGHSVAMMMRRASKYIPKILEKYERAGQMKVVVKVDDEAGLDEIVNKALEKRLLTNVVHDAGRTQIAAGSKTVCCIGPGNGQIIDSVTGHLKLL